jgi:putative ABC transport system permease protein
MLLRFRGWLRALVRRDEVEREMQDEMALHLERATERLIARGMSPAAAQAEARREFGNVAYLQHSARDARGVRWIENALQDMRYAVRGLRRSPGFTLAVVVTLGLGIGANATMFGIVDRLLLRPPEFLIGPDRSHHLYFARMVDGRPLIGQAAQYQRFLDLAESSRTMDVIAAYAPRRLVVGAGDDAREVGFGFASASLWKLFDMRPALGRFFVEGEDREPDGARVAVLSYGYWQSQYGGAADVLGQTIVIWPARYTIVGVAPRGFGGVELETPDVFIPIGMAALDDFGTDWAENRSGYAITWLEIYGRRKSGVTLDAATADLSAAYQASYRRQRDLEPRFTPPIETAKPYVVLGSMLAARGPSPGDEVRVATWLLGVTAIVLLIACANVGNLLLARALGRRREIAVRISLGVSRARLIGQLLIESTLLALLGAFAGVLIAQWGGRFLRTFFLPTVEWQSAMTDRRVLFVAIVSSIAAGLLAGISPMIQTRRTNVVSALKTGAREGRGGRSRLRAGLMLVQVALSMVLLIGCYSSAPGSSCRASSALVAFISGSMRIA